MAAGLAMATLLSAHRPWQIKICSPVMGEIGQPEASFVHSCRRSCKEADWIEKWKYYLQFPLLSNSFPTLSRLPPLLISFFQMEKCPVVETAPSPIQEGLKTGGSLCPDLPPPLFYGAEIDAKCKRARWTAKKRNKLRAISIIPTPFGQP